MIENNEGGKSMAAEESVLITQPPTSEEKRFRRSFVKIAAPQKLDATILEKMTTHFYERVGKETGKSSFFRLI